MHGHPLILLFPPNIWYPLIFPSSFSIHLLLSCLPLLSSPRSINLFSLLHFTAFNSSSSSFSSYLSLSFLFIHSDIIFLFSFSISVKPFSFFSILHLICPFSCLFSLHTPFPYQILPFLHLSFSQISLSLPFLFLLLTMFLFYIPSVFPFPHLNHLTSSFRDSHPTTSKSSPLSSPSPPF